MSWSPPGPERVLWWAAGVHAAVGIVAAVALAFDAHLIVGDHPALKPMKFGFSIALFLGTMALLLPALSLGPRAPVVIAWTLAAAMAVEMAAIALQAVRGVPSHFNEATLLDTAVWRVMAASIVVVTLVVLAVAVTALTRPLAAPPVLAAAWRVGLVFFGLAAVTGFRMASNLSHTVLPHGDLRLAHAIGVHALQSMPLVGAALARLPVAEPARWILLAAALAAHVAVAAWSV